jgi:hypothetical protein
MKNLPRSIVILIITLAIFFNIERLDVNEENIVDIQTFVYILGTVAVVLTIIVPFLRKWSVFASVLFWLGLYLVGKLFLFYHQPIIGEVYTYLTITEVTFLSVLVWLAHRAAKNISDFEEAVENITMVNVNGRVRSLDDALEDIQIEMFRSRNHHHPLSVILIEPEPESLKVILHQAVQEVQNAIMNSYVITKLADSLSRHLRRTDLVLEERERGRFVILCPDTNVNDLEVLVEYIQATAVEILGVSVKYGTATFPEEALTFEELVHQAEMKLHQESTQASETSLVFSENHITN